MNYQEFWKLRAEGKVGAVINNSVASQLVGYLPPLKILFIFGFLLVVLLSVPSFILVAVFYKWWVGLLLLFFGTPILFKTYNQFRVNMVLNHAVTDAEFFKALTERDLISFQFYE